MFGDLVAGYSRAVEFHAPGMAAIAVLDLGETVDTRKLCCWVKYLSGELSRSPALFVAAIDDGMAFIEKAALKAGAAEVRIEGRNWYPVLKRRGYRKFGSGPNEIMKALT